MWIQVPPTIQIPNDQYIQITGQLSTCRFTFSWDAIQVHQRRPIYTDRFLLLLCFLWPLSKHPIAHKAVTYWSSPWWATSEMLISKILWVFLHGRNTGGGALDWICPCLNRTWATTDGSSWKVTRNSHARRSYNWVPRVCESGHLCMQGEDQLWPNT